MDPKHNESIVPKFFLLGFQLQHDNGIILFLALLVIYISTITGNLLIIMLVSTNRHLHSPMYFFLCHLSFCDILLSSSVVPNLLHVTLNNGSHLTVIGCIAQSFFFGFSSGTECLLLTVMSYDRYVAICKPLHYQTIMNFQFCLVLVVLSWVLGSVLSLVVDIMVSQLYFCNSGNIDHFFCDYAPLLQLSCSDTTIVQIVAFTIATPKTITESIFILSTYISIFIVIHRISSTRGRQKAFSTCSSHLAVVCTYYGTLIAIYALPAIKYSINVNKIVSLVYTAVTPSLNPIIYSLRNQEIKNTLLKIMEKRKMYI